MGTSVKSQALHLLLLGSKALIVEHQDLKTFNPPLLEKYLLLF